MCVVRYVILFDHPTYDQTNEMILCHIGKRQLVTVTVMLAKQ